MVNTQISMFEDGLGRWNKFISGIMVNMLLKINLYQNIHSMDVEKLDDNDGR